MFISNNRASFHLQSNENLLKYLTVSKYYDYDCRGTKLWSEDHIYNITLVMWWNFIGHVMDKKYDVITFILKYESLE